MPLVEPLSPTTLPVPPAQYTRAVTENTAGSALANDLHCRHIAAAAGSYRSSCAYKCRQWLGAKVKGRALPTNNPVSRTEYQL